ncbi:MAG: hypothetical protein IJ880_02325 [Bacilli bacterium]|nr:hypothetical protein [Bacilli bacterium]
MKILYNNINFRKLMKTKTKKIFGGLLVAVLAVVGIVKLIQAFQYRMIDKAEDWMDSQEEEGERK